MRTIAVLCDRVGDAGGAERYWETVIPALEAGGNDVHLFARDVAGAQSFGVAASPIAWGAENEPPSPDAARRVTAALAALRPDVIITASVFDTAVLDAVRHAGVRWLARVHDHRMFCPTGDRVYPQFSAPCVAAMGSACRAATVLHGCVHGPRPASFRAITAREGVRDRIAQADAVLVSSEHMRATCVTNGIDARRIAITPPPLPDAAFASHPAPPPVTRTLVFASRLTPRKGLRSLLAALAFVPLAERPRLIVAGTGEREEEAARDDAARAGLEVAWRGHIDANALREEIDGATAVAVPSLWPEPFGLVGIEAQARGRPAIAFRVGGIPEWLGEAGVTVLRGDVRALAAGIRAVFDERAWPELAAAARRHAEAYRLDAHIARFLSLCDAA